MAGTELEPIQADVIQEAGVLTQLARAEIDTQIATAKAYPRSLAQFKATALKMATLDEETAASCFYSLPRDGKQIIGPSARFAEIIAVAWKNLRFGARVVADDGRILTAQGFCRDLENNIEAHLETGRRVTKKNGSRYSDDMIVTTGNAASSIALRNAILKVVPKAYWGVVFDAARKTAIGDSKTMVLRRTQAIDYFAKLHVSTQQILDVLERKAVEEIDLEDLEKLTGLRTAIKDGDTTVEEAFAPTVKATDKIKERLNGSTKPPTQETPPKPAAHEPSPEQQSALCSKETAQAIRKLIAEQYANDLGASGRILKPYHKNNWNELTQAEADDVLAELRGAPETATSRDW